MAREGHSCGHESSSYKVHDHPHMRRKVKQTLSTFQRYGPVRYRKCKTDIAIPREHGSSKEQEKQRVQEEGES